MKSFISKLILHAKRRNLLPDELRRLIQKHVNVMEIRKASWVSKDPYANDPPVSSYESKYPYVLGIIKEFWHGHWHYIAACRDLGVAYKVLDISGPDWEDVIKNAGCDAFLVQPSVQFSIWKQMYDERLRIVVNDMGKIIFPSYEELWFWDSKRRTHYWLKANNVPHPKTWVFYDRDEVLKFVEEVQLPIVYKSDMGSGSSGVIIFRKRDLLRKHITMCFKKGFTTWRRGPSDKEWGSVVLQEYIPDAKEWRMRRIGKSYFGSQKLRIGEFHSGTGVDVWYDPPRSLLDFTREITECKGFKSMSLDIFETTEGRYLVNELHTIFGTNRPYEMLVNGKPGRYLYGHDANLWHFEDGIFCQNASCNLRVVALVEIMGGTVELPEVDVDKMVYEEDRQASCRDYALQPSR